MSKRKTSTTSKVDPEIQAETEGLKYSKEAAAEMFAAADVSRVYGRPVKHEGTTIIPAAEVLWAGGFGAGSDYYKSPEREEEDSLSGSGEGSGGGGRTLARPVAVIIASEEGVRVEPILDPTKILLAAFTAGGFMAAMAYRMMSPRKALRKIDKS
jgi:uncharacterized spore protein YtfJ